MLFADVIGQFVIADHPAIVHSIPTSPRWSRAGKRDVCERVRRT